jgi:transcriptional regulator with XRE-family HTH domain
MFDGQKPDTGTIRPDVGRVVAMTTPTERLASRIRTLRLLADWSQGDLATAMTVNANEMHQEMHWVRSTVAKIEAGQRGVTTDELFRLAAIFSVKVDDLLSPQMRLSIDL